ncbi:hypothetical protein BGZ76_004420 [Entomortierella beljakovae]|nr:hypothetical protein BGZ76_004420 [Entomortierella beljakovae]
MAVPSSMPSLSQQRSFSSQQLQSALSAQHLAPHSSNPSYSSYASSISSAPGSRPASPASMNAGTTINVPTPPQSPTSFQLKTFISSAPPTPPISTVVAVGTPGNITPSSSSSYFPTNSLSTVPSVSLYSLSTQPVTRVVIVLTTVMSLVALGGNFPEHCTAPTHVLYSNEILSLLASPFIIPMTPTLMSAGHLSLGSSLFLGVSNILSLSIFEDYLTAIFNGNGQRIFRNLLLIITVLIMALRQLFGFVFSRSTGWQFPELFFSDSMFECNLGLAPFLFALLIVQSLFPDNGEKTPFFWKLRRTHIQIILCLLNALPKTVIWWAGTGMLVGFLAAILIAFQRQRGHWGGKVKTSTIEKHLWENGMYEPVVQDEEEFSDSTMVGDGAHSYKERKTIASGWTTLVYILPTLFLLAMILLVGNHFHTLTVDVPNDVLNASIEPQTPYLLTNVLMTAPRSHKAAYIKETLTSYLDNFPDEEVEPLYSRIQVVVYTHFTDFPAFDEAKAYFDTIPKARKHVKWVRDDGDEKNQRKHLVTAIRKVATAEETVYLSIMEDDFPFCEGGWQDMLNTIYEANQQVPEHCGIFIGTGGSGLIFKQSVALTASFILERDLQTKSQGLDTPPPDITLQNCMMGQHEFCSSCAGNMVTSRTLLQRHLGYNSSTSGDGYDKDQFQCGWRHPFNGLPYVHTL